SVRNDSRLVFVSIWAGGPLKGRPLRLLPYGDGGGHGKDEFMFAGERALSVNASAQGLIVGANKFKKFCGSAEELLTNGGSEIGEIRSGRGIGGERDGFRAERKNCRTVRNFARKAKCAAFGDVV